ncbi:MULTISPECIES: hypothetical protein [unclassified Pseudomonas]|uniref:hypothetical protein n=1 Tax=unclassified Pseudomonas TaxID=196821 RepID=UPI000A1EE2A9|nr:MULTISPECIES: hypothetical protein [unclassified Pseudomonas]
MKPMDNYVYNSNNTLQKKTVSQTITNFIDDKYANERLGWKWDEILVPCVEDSTFDQIHRSSKVSLSILLRHDDFHFVRARHQIPDNAIFLLDERGRLYFSHRNLVSSNGRPATPFVSLRDITVDVTGRADLEDDLRLLARIAASSGGWIVSGDEISVGQWLRFNGLQVPTNEQETRDLLDLLNFSTLPEPPKYGNYWQLLDAPDTSPFKLEGNNRAIILDLKQSFTMYSEAIVNVLGRSVLIESGPSDGATTSMDYRLQQLLESTASRHGQDYLSRLGWLNEAAATQQSTELAEQLAVAAILLDLDPALDIANTHFAGFDLYARRYFKQHPSQVRTELEAHLIKHLHVAPPLAPLVAQMILAGMAPEYLFADWPSSLRMGTPAWVIATQAVHLVEALAPGASRKMTYQHLMGFSQSTKSLAPLAALQAEGSVDPVVTWAWMNGVITRDAQGDLSAKEIERAMREYDQYIDMTLKAAECFSTPLPDRRQLALQELKSQERHCDPDELLVKHRGSGGGAGRKVSVLDLYMGDELHTQDWDRIKGTSIYKSFPNLPYLYPVTELYESATNSHFESVLEGLARNIQIAISQVLPEDTASLEYGAIGIYCVQNMNYKPARVTGRYGFSPATYVPGETGRYGVILCVKHGYAVKCFELFPLRMECRYNPNLEAFFKPLITGNGYPLDTRFADKKKFELIPVDLQAYLQNVPPKTGVLSRVHVRRIGVLEAPADHSDRDNQIPFYRSSRMETLGRLVARQNPYITEKEIHQLGLQQTAREKAIEKTDAIFNIILNLIIPFKGCVEGLTSGDPKKHGGAIFDCIVDAAVLAMTIFAAPVAIAAAASKAAAIAGKLLSASRVLAKTALSLFNPLSGLPQLLKAGGKLIGRGLTKLSGHTLSLAHQAKQQLRFLTGANSYDLIKAIEHTGSATQLRTSLDTVAHARALFKNDLIEDAHQVLQKLHANDAKRLSKIPESELAHLLEKTLGDIARQSDAAQSLKKVLDPQVVESLIRQQAKKYTLANLHQFSNHNTLPELFETTLTIEYKNLQFMHNHQRTLLTTDLGKAPFDSLLDELKFNPAGLTDNTDRAAAWIVHASSSRNDVDRVKDLLLEFSRNNKPLNDPAVYAELHKRIAPKDAGGLRSPTGEARYPSNVSGAALLEQHAKALDPAGEHFSRQMLGAMLGYHSFVDGNGRTARAVYAIAELRKNRFHPLGKAAEDALSGLN